MGCVLAAGIGQAPARQAALGAGCPDSSGAITFNKVCGSAMRAVMSAANDLRCGDFSLVAAGGMESMSQAPYLAVGVRGGLRLGGLPVGFESGRFGYGRILGLSSFAERFSFATRIPCTSLKTM